MIERSTAIKVRIKDVQEGKYVRASPNYVLTPYGEKVARARVMATVVARFVSEDERYASITVDDGSDTISVRAFRDEVGLIKKIKEGDLVDVIGKIKEYKGEKYLTAECIRVIDDPNWELVRKLELLLKEREREKPEEKGETSVEVEEIKLESGEEKDKKIVILNLIEELDRGEGVKYITLLKESGFDEEELESVLTELMQEGEIYEPKIGRFKRV
ncbi:MAG: hypothetical protein DRN95_05635 [Candidatus Hydrothermarchaeota archaeon]|nr:MAG: hypothetical protein DRN95_05635 [Candidatus Hydrothermarchaeota archaeon]